MGRLVNSPTPAGVRSPIDSMERNRGVAVKCIPEPSLALPVFQQSWWTEIAKRDADYREVEVCKGDEVVGKLGFVVVTNKFGNKLGFQPIWSHLGGPTVKDALGMEERAGVLRELIARLPLNISFKFICSSDKWDAHLVRQAFLEAGFERSSETTYVQYPDDQGILERLSGESKRQIISARKRLEVQEIGADEFIAFYEANLMATGKQSYASLETARALIARGQQVVPQQTRAIAASQMTIGAPLDAAIAYAWDNTRYYLWMTTHRTVSQDRSQEKPHLHAIKLLVLEGTEDARRRGLIFDVDGAATEGNQTLYRDRLKFPHAESRDVFMRDTRVHAIYKQLRPRLRTLWS